MIRLATNNDTLKVVALLKKFLSETTYSQGEEASKDLENLCKITWTAQQHGYIWLAFDHEEQPIGLLMAIKESNIWFPRAKELRELVWYVVPEHRNSSIGGKLFLTFCHKGDQLIEQGLIEGYFTTRMSTTKDIDLERRGFKLKELTYLKER